MKRLTNVLGFVKFLARKNNVFICFLSSVWFSQKLTGKKMLALYSILQDNDQVYIYIGLYICISTEIFSFNTCKSKARFWPRIFWNL